MRLRRASLAGVLCVVVVLLLGPALALAAAPHGEGEHGGGLINLDRSLIVQMINFVVLLFILHRLLYRPLVAKMEERTTAIKHSLDQAQAARAEAARAQQENEARLRQAHAEAAAIREQALKEAGDEARKQMEAAQAQARRIVDDTKAQMNAEIRRARDELRAEVSELATAVAEKRLRRSLREEDHRRIVKDAIAGIRTS